MDHGVRDGFQNLRISMFTDPKAHAKSYPRLKGKAKEIKELAGTLCWYWREYMLQEDFLEWSVWAPCGDNIAKFGLTGNSNPLRLAVSENKANIMHTKNVSQKVMGWDPQGPEHATI